MLVHVICDTDQAPNVFFFLSLFSKVTLSKYNNHIHAALLFSPSQLMLAPRSGTF